MKKQLLFLILAGTLLACSQKIKVKRTVTKTITVPFTINASGNFNTTSSVTASTITNLFDPDIAPNSGSVLDQVDIISFNVEGTIEQQLNTASQVTVNAFVTTGSPTPLLNDTKLIRLGGNKMLQEAKDILNLTTGQIKKEVSFAGALDAINAVGVEKINKIVSENLMGISKNSLVILLNGKVPAGQRMVGTVVLTLNATLTYSRCEVWTGPPFAASECS